MGINTGEMVVGFFGSERGSQYTTMGHEVNLAARLCGKAEPGEVLCGMRTVNEIASLYKADPRRPNDWSHVVSQVWVPGTGWVNNDLTIRQAFPGFEPEGFPFKDWHEPKW